MYDSLIENSEWKIDLQNFEKVSNFAYPLIHSRSATIAEKMAENAKTALLLSIGYSESTATIQPVPTRQAAAAQSGEVIEGGDFLE